MKKITATVIAERTLTCAEDAQREVVVRLAKPELAPEAQIMNALIGSLAPASISRGLPPD